MSDLLPDELLLLVEYRNLKKAGHGDLVVEAEEKRLDVSVKNHGMVKLWTTHKKDLSGLGKLKEV